MPYNLAFKESALKEWGNLDRLISPMAGMAP